MTPQTVFADPPGYGWASEGPREAQALPLAPYLEIRAAAKDLCLENNKTELEFEVARRNCYRTAVSDGLSQMNRAVAAYQSGTSLAAATLTIRGQ